MVDIVLPETAKVVVLVAHPDDETLWAGGTLLMHGGWTTFVATLCRAGDDNRAPNFYRVLDRIGAQGAMADLNDGPSQSPLGTKQVHTTLRSLVPEGHVDLIITHAPNGEYTRHIRHEEVSRAVLEMWARGELHSKELWLFAYGDDAGRRLPSADDNAEIHVDLTDEVWDVKRSLLTDIYGFGSDSWEVRTAPRREAFWRLTTPAQAKARLEQDRPAP